MSCAKTNYSIYIFWCKNLNVIIKQGLFTKDKQAYGLKNLLCAVSALHSPDPWSFLKSKCVLCAHIHTFLRFASHIRVSFTTTGCDRIWMCAKTDKLSVFVSRARALASGRKHLNCVTVYYSLFHQGGCPLFTFSSAVWSVQNSERQSRTRLRVYVICLSELCERMARNVSFGEWFC